MANPDDFMRNLHAQTSGGDEARRRQDRAIMRILGSWIYKRTPKYLKFTDDGASDAEYLGSKAKKACVDKDIAREKAEQYLMGLYDSEGMEEIKEEFDAAYDDALEDPWWRES